MSVCTAPHSRRACKVESLPPLQVPQCPKPVSLPRLITEWLPMLQVDRNEDMLRSCLRAVEAISRIPGVNACEPWRNFMQVHDHAVQLSSSMVANHRTALWL